MENKEIKKGLFNNLFGKRKDKKQNSCCNFEIEEIEEQTVEQNENK